MLVYRGLYSCSDGEFIGAQRKVKSDDCRGGEECRSKGLELGEQTDGLPTAAWGFFYYSNVGPATEFRASVERDYIMAPMHVNFRSVRKLQPTR
jgi:hypothetical protein